MLEFLEYQAQRVVDLVEAVLHVLLDFANCFFEIILAHIDLWQITLDLADVALEFFDRVPDNFQDPASKKSANTYHPVKQRLVHCSSFFYGCSSGTASQV